MAMIYTDPDQEYWINLVKDTGWTLHSWHDRNSAFFNTPDNVLIEINSQHANLIKIIRENAEKLYTELFNLVRSGIRTC